jgi:hypothetical protein
VAISERAKKAPTGLLLGAVISSVLVGCALTTQPIGSVPDDIDPSDWEGVWVHEESFDVDAVVAVLTVLDRDDARLGIDWLRFDDGDTRLEHWTGILRILDDEIFLNVTEQSEGVTSPRYAWARIQKDGDLAFALVPSYEELEKLVLNGALPGHIDNARYEITLTELTAEHMRFLASNSLPTVPVLFRRIAK